MRSRMSTNIASLDVGCGPGHVTSFLASKGLRISGVDISPALVSLAEATFPDLSFSVASFAELPTDASSLDGLVSRHSIIHTEPDRLDDVVSEFARVLAPHGCLFLSFFALAESGTHAQPFDHAVCTAYQLDPSVISKLLARHGLIEEIQLIRRPREGERQIPHATLIARRH